VLCAGLARIHGATLTQRQELQRALEESWQALRVPDGKSNAPLHAAPKSGTKPIFG